MKTIIFKSKKNANKAKFFAQYLGTEVEYTFNEYEGTNLSYSGRHIAKLVGVTCYNDYEILVDTGTDLYPASEPENPMLLLKGLQSISDEDAIEICKIMDVDYSNDQNSEAHFDLEGCIEWIVALFEEPAGYYVDGYTGNQLLNLCDFLRSRGYALPFHHIATAQQVNAGWVKLI